MEEMKDADIAMNSSHPTEIKIDDPEKEEIDEECEVKINIVIESDPPNKENRPKKGKKKEERVKTGDEDEILEEEKTNEKGKTRFPLAKIKNIMKNDENIKLVQKDVYNLLGKATELFLQELANNALLITNLNRRKTMNIEDISAAIKRNDRYEFINMKLLLDDVILEDLNKKELITENKINASKDKASALIKTEEKKSQSKIKPKKQVINSNNHNLKIDSFFHKNI